MRVTPSIWKGTSMAVPGLRFRVIGTTFGDLRMAHPRLIQGNGIQSFSSKRFQWLSVEEERALDLHCAVHRAMDEVTTPLWRRPRGGQDATSSHNGRFHYGAPDRHNRSGEYSANDDH